MGLFKRAQRIMAGVHEFGVDKVAPAVGKVVNKAVNKAPDAINKTAGVIDKTIKKGQKAVGKVKDGTLQRKTNEVLGKVSKTVLTDESSYSKIGKTNVEVANKALFADDINRRVKSIGDKGATIYEAISKDKVNIPGTNMKMSNPMKLIKKDEESLLGLKATKRGALVAGGVMLASGIPDAGRQFVEGRQGTNMDQQPVTSSPRTPAYAQNGGATGDLVFALNNLRHGGMM